MGTSVVAFLCVTFAGCGAAVVDAGGLVRVALVGVFVEGGHVGCVSVDCGGVLSSVELLAVDRVDVV